MQKQSSERKPVVPPRQYDAGVEAAAKTLEKRYRPSELALYVNSTLPNVAPDVLIEVEAYVSEHEGFMSASPIDRNLPIARLIIRAAFQAANDEARAAHKTLPYPSP